MEYMRNNKNAYLASVRDISFNLGYMHLFLITYIWKSGALRKKTISGALSVLFWLIISFGLIYTNILLLAVAALFTFKVTGSI